MKDQKQLWNVQSSSGNTLNDTPISGTKKQATVYMNCMYDHCTLIIFEPLDLDKLMFIKKNDIIISYSGGIPKFRCHIMGDLVGIIDEVSPIFSLPIEQLRLFPNFASIE